MKNTSVSFLTVLLVSVFLIFAAVAASFSYSIQDDDFCTNPDSVIASEIIKGKIVMLGESPHHDFILYDGLINVLHNWVQNCEKDKSQNFTLNLVLEMDSLMACYIDRYVKTGNDSLLYARFVPFLYMEDIEFYECLRKVGMEIENLNEKRNGKIVLNVLGFEEVGLDKDENHLRKNRIESEKWFVNERDRNISVRLIEFIKSHDKTDHYLIYYGAAHLEGGYVNKNLGFSIPNEESFGYYLRYYLKQEFGEDSIVPFVQGVYIDNVFDRTFLSRYSGKDFMISSDKMPLEIMKPEPDLLMVIRHFLRPYRKYEPHYFPMVFSRFIIEKLSKRIEVLENCLPGYKANLFYISYLQNIFFITGEKLDNGSKLKEWLKTNAEFNGLERIDSKEYASFIFEVLKESKENNRERLLNDFGFSSEDLTPYSKDPAYWFENWKAINRKAKFINAIGIYWIGYPDEKVSAKKYLIEFTGEDHSEPQKYLKWFRKKYFNYED